jgi:hypothetical protein
MLKIKLLRAFKVLMSPLLYAKQLIYFNTPTPTHEVKEVPKLKGGVFSTTLPDAGTVKHPQRTLQEAMSTVQKWRINYN